MTLELANSGIDTFGVDGHERVANSISHWRCEWSISLHLRANVCESFWWATT
jgi:hypothetical protein